MPASPPAFPCQPVVRASKSWLRCDGSRKRFAALVRPHRSFTILNSVAEQLPA